MIRHPLALRLDPEQPLKEQIHGAARLGLRGVVLDAIGDLAPHRLGATGRRELRHLLRTVELSLAAVALPTRRPFDTTDQLDERIRRADAALALAYELGTSIVLVRAGAIPPSADAERLEIFTAALRELSFCAEHRGAHLVLETGSEPPERLAAFLALLQSPALGASVDSGFLLQAGIDPVTAVRALGSWVLHAYANDATGVRGVQPINPRGIGFPPGALDWPEYLGALEEIGYQGFLTIWPAPGQPATQVSTILNRLKEIA
jgi:sugar phosphate isomerase/epimerase